MSRIVGGTDKSAPVASGVAKDKKVSARVASDDKAQISKTGLSTRSVSSLESRALKALKSHDISALKAVFSHASPQTFLKASCNEAGDTLVHVAARDGNLDALHAMILFSEGPITLHENAKGETSKEILEEKNLYTALASRVGYDEQGIRQMRMLEKFATYLELKASENPGEYDVKAIISELGIGHCSGLAIHWMELSMNDRSDEYYEEVSAINQWDGRAESLTDDLDQKIGEFIQLIRFSHQMFYEKPDLAYKDDPKLSPEVQAEARAAADAEKVKLASLMQDSLVEIIGRGDKYQSSSAFFHYHMLPKFLEYSLNENNSVYLSSTPPGFKVTGHIVGVKMRGGKLYLFDSNHKGNEENYSPEHSAIEYASIPDLMKGMTDSLKIVHGNQTVPASAGTRFVVLDKKGAEEGRLSLSNADTRARLLDQKFRAGFETCEDYCSFINGLKRDPWGMDATENGFLAQVIAQETIDGELELSLGMSNNLEINASR